MKRLALLFVLFIVSTVSGQQEDVKNTVSDLGWISGCWRQDRGPGRYVLEQWTAPAGMILGMARTYRDGKITSYEYLRIEEKDGDIFYVAIPSRQKETFFKLTSLKDGTAVFENPEHDFPQKIIYMKTESGISARVEGSMNGQTRGFDVVFGKGECAQ